MAHPHLTPTHTQSIKSAGYVHSTGEGKYTVRVRVRVRAGVRVRVRVRVRVQAGMEHREIAWSNSLLLDCVDLYCHSAFLIHKTTRMF